MTSYHSSLPHLEKIERGQQLIVDGKPFLMLGGELQNSSLTSAAYMDIVWQKLADTNVNTVLGCVTWEDIEPKEGEFGFSELDKVIKGARAHGLRLVLLWFGSFKNGKGRHASNVSSLTQPRYLDVCPFLGEEGCQAFPSSAPSQSWGRSTNR
jgi:hypothetical protein